MKNRSCHFSSRWWKDFRFQLIFNVSSHLVSTIVYISTYYAVGFLGFLCSISITYLTCSLVLFSITCSIASLLLLPVHLSHAGLSNCDELMIKFVSPVWCSFWAWLFFTWCAHCFLSIDSFLCVTLVVKVSFRCSVSACSLRWKKFVLRLVDGWDGVILRTLWFHLLLHGVAVTWCHTCMNNVQPDVFDWLHLLALWCFEVELWPWKKSEVSWRKCSYTFPESSIVDEIFLVIDADSRSQIVDIYLWQKVVAEDKCCKYDTSSKQPVGTFAELWFLGPLLPWRRIDGSGNSAIWSWLPSGESTTAMPARSPWCKPLHSRLRNAGCLGRESTRRFMRAHAHFALGLLTCFWPLNSNFTATATARVAFLCPRELHFPRHRVFCVRIQNQVS